MPLYSLFSSRLHVQVCAPPARAAAHGALPVGGVRCAPWLESALAHLTAVDWTGLAGQGPCSLHRRCLAPPASSNYSTTQACNRALVACAGATEGMFGVGSDFVEYADAYRKAAAATAASSEATAAAGGGGEAANGAAQLANGASPQRGGTGSTPSTPSRPPGFPAFQDFPRDAEGQSSYILIPDAGGWVGRSGWAGGWVGGMQLLHGTPWRC